MSKYSTISKSTAVVAFATVLAAAVSSPALATLNCPGSSTLLTVPDDATVSATPSPSASAQAQHATYGGVQTAAWDQPDHNHVFADTLYYINLIPAAHHVTKARVTIRLAPRGEIVNNDAVNFQQTATGGFAVGSFTRFGYRISLLPGPSAQWATGAGTAWKTFVFDFSQGGGLSPPPTTGPSGAQVLTGLSVNRFLDVEVQDDTAVHSITLEICHKL